MRYIQVITGLSEKLVLAVGSFYLYRFGRQHEVILNSQTSGHQVTQDEYYRIINILEKENGLL